MGRQLRSIVPTLQDHLNPKTLPWNEIYEKEAAYRANMEENFNARHKPHTLEHLPNGVTVWVSDRKEKGVVVRKDSAPRSYHVQTPSTTVRRNRQQIVRLPEPEIQERQTPSETKIPLRGTVTPTKSTPNQQDIQTDKQPPKGEDRTQTKSSQDTQKVTTTRSGRRVIPPQRLDL